MLKSIIVANAERKIWNQTNEYLLLCYWILTTKPLGLLFIWKYITQMV